LNLGDILYQVRNDLGEITPNFWSNSELIYHINTGAKAMCRKAQNLNSGEVVSYAEGQQEAALSVDVDMITYIAYFSGQLFPLAPISENQVKFGGYMTGIPYYFYVKTDTLLMFPQVSGGDMQIQPVPQAVQGNNPDPRTVIGLWPIPAMSTQVNFEYIPLHPFVTKPLDPIRIPDEFVDGVVYYAMSRALRKEKAFDEADRYLQLFQNQSDDFMGYSVMQKQVAGTIMYGDNTPPIWARGSSSVIMVNQNPTFIDGVL
jgi:hypothetical protein